jgi:phosphoribosylpyrophosphate synthetase
VIARLEALPIQRLVGTNSVEPHELPPHLQVVNLDPLIGEAIGRLHQDQSLEPLLARA